MRILDVSALVKAYGGLRPLRLDRFTLDSPEQVAVLGVDQAAAEVLINLLTGVSVPDRGEVLAFGRSTASIETSADWLALVDRFGIVSGRAVLLEALSVVQNLAMPFSLDIEPPPASIRARAATLAAEVGLPEGSWDRKVAELGTADRLRVRLGRALALDPEVVLLDHPTTDLPRREVERVGRAIRRILERRAVAGLTLTADAEFAAAVAPRVLALEPSTGRLYESRTTRAFFRWSDLFR